MESTNTQVNETVIQEAQRVVDGARQTHYGHPYDNHSNTAELWTSYLRRRGLLMAPLIARDVCMMMVLLKVSRDANLPKRDNLVDIVGYARNAEMVQEREDAWLVQHAPLTREIDAQEFSDLRSAADKLDSPDPVAKVASDGDTIDGVPLVAGDRVEVAPDGSIQLGRVGRAVCGCDGGEPHVCLYGCERDAHTSP